MTHGSSTHDKRRLTVKRKDGETIHLRTKQDETIAVVTINHRSGGGTSVSVYASEDVVILRGELVQHK